MFTATMKDIEEAYALARSVAADHIGYPTCEEDERAIAEATPAQAIRSLQAVINQLKNKG